MAKRPANTVGKRIRAVRKKVGRSIEAVAADAGIHPNYLGAVERGEKVPTMGVMDKIAGALGTYTTVMIDAYEAKTAVELKQVAIERLNGLDAEQLKRLLRVIDAVRF